MKNNQSKKVKIEPPQKSTLQRDGLSSQQSAAALFSNKVRTGQ